MAFGFLQYGFLQLNHYRQERPERVPGPQNSKGRGGFMFTLGAEGPPNSQGTPN